MSPHRYRALDGWRGLCAITVAVYHYPRVLDFLHWPIFSAGWIFVDFFFVLSGFVITHRYLVAGHGVDLALFIRARLVRLYPVHVVALFLTLAATLLVAAVRYATTSVVRVDGAGDSLAAFAWIVAKHAAMMQGFESFGSVGLNVPSWSISVEFWTNIAFALLARAGGLNRLSLVFIVLAATVLLATQPPSNYLDGSFVSNSVRSVQGFALGALAYLSLERGLRLAKAGRLAMSIAELACLGMVVVAAAVARQLTLVWLLPFVFSLCVLAFAHERGVISDVLTSSFCQRAGELSYAIYLVHFAWVGLFYAAGTAAVKLPELGSAAEKLAGSALAPAGLALYLLAVWISASILTRMASLVYARA